MKTSTCSTLVMALYLLFGLQLHLQAQMPNYPMEPASAEIVYTDLENFVTAYAQLSSEKDTLQILESLYFEKGSPGLKEFVNRHQLTAELLKEAIRKHPEDYERIPEFIAGIENFKFQFGQAMLDYGKTIPNVMYAPTYLLVGAHRGIAQASMVGQLVTITRIVDDPDKLITMIVHELSHFQQAKELGGQKYVSLYSQPNNMLGLCLREGGAEFLTYLALGRITQNKSLDYLSQNESELKERFTEDLEKQNSEFWLWESINQNTYPILLGYTMGFQICKSYYDRSTDKSEALQNILAIQNPEELLESSRYLSN